MISRQCRGKHPRDLVANKKERKKEKGAWNIVETVRTWPQTIRVWDKLYSRPSPPLPFLHDVILYRSLATTSLCRGSLSAKRKRQPNDQWQPLRLFFDRCRLVGSPTGGGEGGDVLATRRSIDASRGQPACSFYDSTVEQRRRRGRG